MAAKIYIKNQQKLKKLNQQRIKRELNKALCVLGFSKAELSILFVNNRTMQLLNSRYRGINKVTDVLSFPQLSEEVQKRKSVKAQKNKRTKIISRHHVIKAPNFSTLGDIVICVPQALKQAKEYNVSFYNELLRLLIHGLLHLLGYNHEESTYHKKRVEIIQRELLNAIKTMD